MVSIERGHRTFKKLKLFSSWPSKQLLADCIGLQLAAYLNCSLLDQEEPVHQAFTVTELIFFLWLSF